MTGSKVNARIVVYEGNDAIKVPTSALFRHGDEWAAYVVKDGRAQLRKTEIGHRSAADAEVFPACTPATRWWSIRVMPCRMASG